MYTIDASVWINSFDKRETGNEISRSRQNTTQAIAFANSLKQLPNTKFLANDSSFAQKAVALAATQKLRGADALYATTAVEANCKLATLDKEQLNRLENIVDTITPAQALATLQVDREDNPDQ